MNRETVARGGFGKVSLGGGGFEIMGVVDWYEATELERDTDGNAIT